MRTTHVRLSVDGAKARVIPMHLVAVGCNSASVKNGRNQVVAELNRIGMIEFANGILTLHGLRSLPRVGGEPLKFREETWQIAFPGYGYSRTQSKITNAGQVLCATCGKKIDLTEDRFNYRDGTGYECELCGYEALAKKRRKG